ncbi:hypothetical protein LCGC14_2067440 [marine sediment metagenome]|uniref:Uncharacterized protein n=1 Tax=marine sediment metagenome TaxID=412755 RepID=A0A0F9HGE1_9ZZZZ
MESNYRNQKEVEDNFSFERRCQPYADDFYRSKGYTPERVEGPENKLYDVKLKKNGVKVTVEEKFLRNDADIMFVEIKQDTETDAPGWIEYTRATYLFYVMPSGAILCFMSKLKKFIRYYGSFYPDAICTKGWGRTLNKVIPIEVILENKIGKDVGSIFPCTE